MTFAKRIMAVFLVSTLLITASGCKKDADSNKDKSYYEEITEIMDIVSKDTKSDINSKFETSVTSGAASSTVKNQSTVSSKDQKSSTDNTTGSSSNAVSSTTSSNPKITYPKKDYSKSLKILAIGNSFSVDSMEYLYDICKSAGIQEVILGNLHKAGCELKTHYGIIINSKSEYGYSKNTNGVWNSTTGQTIHSGLKDENWDIIVLQQYSGNSGLAYTFGELNLILRWLDLNKTSSETRFMWNLTWAYQSTSNHNDFAKYNYIQMNMYNKIVGAVQSKVLTEDLIAGVIPTGTAIQNLRSSYIGDVLTRDGQHLSHDYGRYTAALTWFHYITGISLNNVDWVPSKYSSITNDLTAVKESVTNSVQTPYAVTASKYTQKPQ